MLSVLGMTNSSLVTSLGFLLSIDLNDPRDSTSWLLGVIKHFFN